MSSPSWAAWISCSAKWTARSRRRSLMNEESRWRYTLAQQIAPHYSANPKVAAVAVAGSVARVYADRSSDLDLAVFWSEPPTAKERRDTFTRARGRQGS